MLKTIAFLIVFVNYLEQILTFLVLARVVLSWLPLKPNRITGFIIDSTQPLFALVYRLFPSLRRSAIDFSPIIVFFGIQILRNLLVELLLKLA